MNPASTQHIEKLDENNYESWKLHMRSILIYNDLWAYVNGTKVKTEDPTQAADWTSKDDKALAIIVLSVKQSQLTHIKKAHKQAWDDLEKIFKSKGPVRKAALYKQLHQMRKNPEQSMAHHVNAFMNKAEQLEEVGILIPSELLSIMLLSSLPDEYENFCVAIESRDDLPKPDILKIKLIEEEARRTEQTSRQESAENYQNALWTHQKSNGSKKTSTNGRNFRSQQRYPKPPKFFGKCFKCGKVGHRAAICRSTTHNKANHAVEEENVMTAALGASVLESNEWYLDSGATTHMCKNRDLFIELNSAAKFEIQTAGENKLQAVGTGTIVINVKSKNVISRVRLENAMFCPDLRSNLLLQLLE